jgi:hypothetical protein
MEKEISEEITNYKNYCERRRRDLKKKNAFETKQHPKNLKVKYRNQAFLRYRKYFMNPKSFFFLRPIIATASEYTKIVQTPVQHTEQAVQVVQGANTRAHAQGAATREARSDQGRAESQVQSALRALQVQPGRCLSAAESEANRVAAARAGPAQRGPGEADECVVSVACAA